MFSMGVGRCSARPARSRARDHLIGDLLEPGLEPRSHLGTARAQVHALGGIRVQIVEGGRGGPEAGAEVLEAPGANRYRLRAEVVDQLAPAVDARAGELGLLAGEQAGD